VEDGITLIEKNHDFRAAMARLCQDFGDDYRLAKTARVDAPQIEGRDWFNL
jgi:hypothetical protein